jgi:hypothetical protein
MTTAARFRLQLIAAALVSAAACNDSVDPVAPRVPAARASLENAVAVTTTAELLAALSPGNAGRRILVRSGTYDIDRPITIPDSVTLEGEGTMLSDGEGRPAGFGSGAHTTLRMTANVPGDVLTLGNGVTIKHLEIVDRTGRSGNVVAVYSRAPRDSVAATILESQIVNANAGFYGLYVQTRNLNLGNPPAPHEGAVITVRMARSLVTSSVGGRGVFAFNFAPTAKVAVTLNGNVLGGITANGGVSLPDEVHDSQVRIESHGNLYRNEASDPCTPVVGWNLTGGSGAPVPIPASGTARNTLRMQSVRDRIEHFTTAIQASGSRRYFGAPVAGASTDDTLDLELLDATLATPSCGSAQAVRDLDLKGAFSASDALAPGDGNTLRAVIRGVTGSGQRSNLYADAGGASAPLPTSMQGTGNRLVIMGSPEAFARTNRRIDPAPAPEFFSSEKR